MAMPEMDAVKDAALKYDKPTLARLAQSGQLSPTLAVMAGMMRDRIVQSEMKPPEPATVAEEVMQPTAQKMGLAAAAQAPQMQQPQGQGLDQVPIPEAMFDEQRMAGGGIVAFQAGGGARNPRLIGALENVLSQLQTRDPALNVDYVRRAVLSAPESQQRTLMQQLVERVGMEDQFKPAAASFTESLKTKEVDPNVMRAVQLAGGFAPNINSLAQQEADARRNQLISNIPMEPSAPALAAAVPPGGDLASGLNPNLAEPLYESQSGIEYIGDDKMGTGAGQKRGLGAVALKPPVEARKTAGQYAADAKSMFNTLYGDYAKGLTKPDREAMGLETIDYLERSGVNLGLASQQAARLAEEREELAGDRKEAANLRLIEAGLGILGGESPYAFVNIGKGASPAVKGFSQDIKDVKKAQRDLDRSRDQLEVAQNQMNMGVASMTQNRYDKRVDAVERNQSELQKTKGDLAVKLMTNDNARDIVTMQMQKKSSYEIARDDYVAGGGRASDFSQAYIGQTKAGAMTQDEFDQFSVEQWNNLKPSEKRRLKKQGIENFEAYKRYLERNRTRGSLLDGSSGAKPQLSDNPLQLDPNTLNANR